MRNLAPFEIGSVIRKLNHIHFQINAKHQIPFPKPEAFWLSKYTYERRYIRIHEDGSIEGGLSRFVSSLIDFAFIRSIVAHRYSLVGNAYDPISLFLLDLFRHLEKYPDMKTFVVTLHDGERGKNFRLYAGITSKDIPCEATFTNFKERLGEELYNQIFHILVEIAEYLGFVSYKIIATDGTLFPTNARYRGCTWFEGGCNCVEFGGIIENVRKRVRYRLNHPDEEALHKEIRIKAECPSNRFPEDAKIPRPKVEVLTLALQQADRKSPASSTRSSAFRRNCNGRTSIELELGIELPVACTTIAGNGEEGRHFITNKNKILHHHGNASNIHLPMPSTMKQTTISSPVLKGQSPLSITTPDRKTSHRKPWKQGVTITKAVLTPPVVCLPDPTASIKNGEEPLSPAGVIASDQLIRRFSSTPKTASTGSTTTGSLVICPSAISPG